MNTVEQGEYELLSSTRFDPFLSSLTWNNDNEGACSFFLLSYHCDRLLSAAEHHGWAQLQDSLDYTILKRHCVEKVRDRQIHDPLQDSFRVRITVSKLGSISIALSSIPPFAVDPTSTSFFNPLMNSATLFGPVVSLRRDCRHLSPSLFTITKTTNRVHYDDARIRNALPLLSNSSGLASDVILYNTEGLITETTIFNIAIFRSPSWFTPAASSGCLNGVLRRWLIEQGRIYEDLEGTLNKNILRKGDFVLLFNGVQGCRLGKIDSEC